jgi:hypothetical protein
VIENIIPFRESNTVETRNRSELRSDLPPQYADLTEKAVLFFFFRGRFSQFVQRLIMTTISLNLAMLRPIG